jgi:hypothetical protein
MNSPPGSNNRLTQNRFTVGTFTRLAICNGRRQMKRHLLVFITRALVLSLTCVGITCRAASFERLDFDQITTGAEQIFFGTLGSASSMYTSPREIVTDFRFVDVEILKGDLSDPSPKIRMLGGTVGDISLTIAGAPTFVSGKRYLVFIARNGKVMFPTLGGPQGIFEARLDAASGETTMYDYGGRALTSLPGSTVEPVLNPKGESLPGLAVSSKVITKSAFVKEIQKRLGQ